MLRHARGIDRLIGIFKKKVKQNYQKIILLFDTEEGRIQFKYVNGILTRMGIETPRKNGITASVSKDGKTLVILSHPNIEEGFIRKYDKSTKAEKYKSKEGKKLIKDLIEKENRKSILG